MGTTTANFISVIIPQYLSLIISWPVVIFLIFISLKSVIERFIDEIGELAWGDRRAIRRNKQEEIKGIEASNNDDRWNWKMLFLDRFLSKNSLSALKWFYDNEGAHTHLDFSKKFTLPEKTSRNTGEEIGAILQALRETGLLEVKSNKHSISEEGKNYLAYKDLI